jgi:hypothetical protein
MPSSEQTSECRRVCGSTPFARIDQQYREIGGRGAGNHIARVLLVPGRVGDDERAPRSREEAVGDINRDALLPLVFQPVEQQREIDIVAGRAEALRLALEPFELVVQNQPGVVKQPADQRRFAVIDRSAGQKPQQLSIGDSAHRSRIVGHQK